MKSGLFFVASVLLVSALLFGCTAQKAAPSSSVIQAPTTFPTQAATVAPTATSEATATPEATAEPTTTPTPTTEPTIQVVATLIVTPTPTPGPDVQEFMINASEWKFEPNTISVRKGVKVRFIVQSLDQGHGIAIREPNWGFQRQLIKPSWNVATGKNDLYFPETIDFVPNSTGDFRYFNYYSNGEGADKMYGILHVTD